MLNTMLKGVGIQSERQRNHRSEKHFTVTESIFSKTQLSGRAVRWLRRFNLLDTVNQNSCKCHHQSKKGEAK